MTDEEMISTAQAQTALMLVSYHRAVNALLDELLDAVLQQDPYCREATNAVRRFRTTVQTMALDWCRA